MASKANFLEAEAARDVAAANLEEVKPSLELEHLALRQMTLRAPFSGVMSAPLVKENGWQDKAKSDIRMAVITQLDPIRVVGQVRYSVYAERRKVLKTDEAAKEGLALSLVLPDGGGISARGQAGFGRIQVRRATQKLTVWAEFPNPDRLLRPGLKVTLRSRLVNP